MLRAGGARGCPLAWQERIAVMDLGETLRELAWRCPPWEVAAVAGLGFAAIYFGLGGLSVWLTRDLLPARGIGRVIDPRPLAKHQVRSEVQASLVSIGIFGLYGALTLWLDARGLVHIVWRFAPLRGLLDVLFMVLWNELHFYACHRLLHTRWLFRHVHRVHHRSVVPTPWATYAFHPIEAILLGSVMITALLVHDLSILAVLLYPLVSLAMNCLGHLNYALWEDRPLGRLLAASVRHSQHHHKVKGNFGFLIPQLDAVLATAFPPESR
jgi:sterol desaturase/sphingolipid hydroxylase (fatty acid hydroxylase superfamily)